MKKFLQIPLLLVALFLTSIPISAYDFEVDGFYYNITNKTNKTVAFVGANYRYSGSVEIPQTVIETDSGTTYSVTSIGNKAFSGWTGMTSVSIPNSVAEIGESAFSGCTGLTEVTIPNSVTSIKQLAFQSCTSITVVNFNAMNCSSNAYSMAPVFNGCINLKTVNIGNNVKKIPQHTFAGCSSLTSMEIPNSVTSIGNGTFSGCSSLTKLTIPNSITSIGDYAFSGCTGLTSVTIPNSVTEIGGSAFSGCTGLTEVNFNAKKCKSKSVSDHYDAFSGCSNLKTVNIGDNVTNVPAYVFKGCSGLSKIIVAPENPHYDSRDNCNAIINTSNNTLILGCKNTIIPNSVSVINGYAFYNCTGLTSVSIPNSVTSIGSSAFYGCTGLTSVSIPNSVTSIGSSAFYNTPWYNNQPDGVVYINEFLYGYKGTMPEGTSIEVKEGTISINSNAFYNCTGLTSVSIPNSVTSIGGGAFYNCTGLTEVNYNAENCTSMGSIFSGCTNLKTINIGNRVKTIPSDAFSGCTGLTEVSIPNSVTSIGSSAFSGCNGLTTISIPNSVTSIGGSAFYGCTGLFEVNISDLSAWCKIEFGSSDANPLYYAKKLILNGTEITNLVIPNDISKINNYAFYNCSSFTSVTIPNSITSIGYCAFYGCTGLTSITIPNSVTSIGDSAFYGCTNLTSVSIPNSVTEIGYNAFYNTPWYSNQPDGVIYINQILYGYNGTMPEGTSIEVKEGTISINSNAFYNCTGLTSITIPNSVTEIGHGTFYGCTGLTSVTIPNSVTEIGTSAFSNCTNLTSVSIPNSVTAIGAYAFYGCTGLTSVSIPNSVTAIGAYAFYGCTGLTEVSIPNSVTSIYNSAFSGCTGLTSVTIPNSVTEIGSQAFYNCSGLASLSGGERLSTIGTQVFWGCDKLVDVNVTTTQTTITVNMSSPTQYNLGLYHSDSDKYQAENGVVKFTGLRPNYIINGYDLALIINDIYCPIKDLSSYTTCSFEVNLEGSVTASSVSATGIYTEGDMTILGEGINYGSNVSEYNGKNTIKINNLDPNTDITVYYAVNTQEGGVYTVSETFTTSALELTTQDAKPTSTTSVRLLAATNCDATEGIGFEWRRYDAPEEFPSSKVGCPVVDGVLVGTLRGVKDDVYYKYRPYYTSSSGNTYYGDWILFFTGDANVYFEPEVRTYEDIQVINNSATVKGYALEGTDVITAQGFEYWKTGTTIKPASTDDRMTVNASGISMSATLANLEYNSTYKYRAFVTTAKGTTYGDEVEFSTGNDPAGIGYIEVDGVEFSVTLRENPATGTAWVKILGASGNEAQYVLTSISGAMVANGTMMLDGEWNAIELNCSAGMYLLTINDGTQVKTLRLIVK